MLTQQTSDTCIYQFQFWLPTEYLVDKWHNQYMDLVVFKYFCPLSVCSILSLTRIRIPTAKHRSILPYI